MDLANIWESLSHLGVEALLLVVSAIVAYGKWKAHEATQDARLTAIENRLDTPTEKSDDRD